MLNAIFNMLSVTYLLRGRFIERGYGMYTEYVCLYNLTIWLLEMNKTILDFEQNVIHLQKVHMQMPYE